MTRKHAIYSGPFMSEQKSQAGHTNRFKSNPEVLTKLAHFLEGSEVLQSYAYGERITLLFGKLTLSALDNVDYLQKAWAITVEFIPSIDAKMLINLDDYQSCETERCWYIVRNLIKICIIEQGHKEDRSVTCAVSSLQKVQLVYDVSGIEHIFEERPVVVPGHTLLYSQEMHQPSGIRKFNMSQAGLVRHWNIPTLNRSLD